MNLFKKSLALLLALLLTLSLAGCGQKAQETAEEPGTPEAEAPVTPETDPDPEYTFRVAALKGPTAMGMVRMMALTETASAGYNHLYTLAAAADEVTPALIKGDLDMACVPANLAATLYQKTEGEIVTLAVNTLGVIYIVENGNAVASMADLAGQTIVAAGKGSTPEYALRYLLSENGVDPDTDVIIDWKSEHSECVSALATGAATIALLPQPFVTVAQGKIESLRVALDLTEEWDALDNGSGLITGVVVARKAFVEEHPAALEAFLEEYADSVAWVNENPADAAQLVVDYGILESAAVAEKALPYCNIVCITGEEMKEKLSGYLQVLFDAEPASVGGALPEDGFYYGA
ncbi:MAG: ABC transporter substrate-binding protein [Oscillospiraceae bacterium]|nr:ABC transporter substrate-binding protein [Oscillospiraceae bacterium]